MKFDLKHRRVLRTFVGLVAGAVITSLLADPVLYFSGSAWALTLSRYTPQAIPGSLGTAAFAILLVVPLGIVAHAVLYRQNRRGLGPWLALSALGGLGLGFGLGPQYMNLAIWLFSILCGLVCGLIAWLIRRPDMDTPPPAA
ncbi:MAG: hypothetical protein JF615_00860 [Asticcacaulis sp.]|nr:hypothetical protein [Asticcacaulis sp.]